MTKHQALSPDKLYRRCDEKELGFATTDELEVVGEIFGQARALEAIEFGIGIRQVGFNIYALGPAGTGKHTVVRQLLERQAQQDPAPFDWCYVNNFDDPHKPRVLRLPCGMGLRLRQDMTKLVDELRHSIPAAFETDEYRAQVQKIEQEFKDQQETALDEIRRRANEKGIALLRTPGGFAFAPVREDEVLSPAEYEKLPKDEQQRLESEIEVLQEELRKVIRQIPVWRGRSRERLKSLNRDVAKGAVGYALESIRKSYAEQSQVVEYLDAVEKDVIDNVDEFRREEEGTATNGLALLTGHAAPFNRYEVNVLVDHSDSTTAPVVYEDHPTYLNLVGRVEHIAMMGALITDFRLVKAGALHRANNGYLVLDALKLLQHPYAWEGLKRALHSGEIRIQSLEQMLSLASTVSLEAESIPLNVKVVLIGDRMLYYMLYHLDPEFSELFKVAADFEDTADWDQENNSFYARLVATLAKKHELRSFTAAAVARVIERSARIVEDSEKLSTHMRSVTDLLAEADYWAQRGNATTVDSAHVVEAIAARDKRSGRLKERSLEAIERNTVFVDTSGARIGTVNGLSILGIGDVEFGLPSRITATVRMGEGDVVNIEREVELSGPFHSKGVYILSACLSSRYATNRPLSLAASLVFEQSYAEIDGDSASSAELYALLSAIAEVPIKQCYAVTGSVNQHGEVQAIGGVNEKIEGFFALCKRRGLTGEQGVLIPEANIKHLMLKDEVVEAATAGMFHIFPVANIDQGIEILTGIEAGTRDEKGEFPADTLNSRIETRLHKMAELRHEFVAHPKALDDVEHSDGSDDDDAESSEDDED